MNNCNHVIFAVLTVAIWHYGPVVEGGGGLQCAPRLSVTFKTILVASTKGVFAENIVHMLLGLEQ